MGEQGDPGRRLDPVAVLGDLPVPLWRSVVHALRRAVDRLPRADLPVGLRPYAGWTPESLSTARPRRAVAEALVTDARLREQMGDTVDDPEAHAATAGEGDRLVEVYGEEAAVVTLVSQGRWDDVAVLAATAAERLARRDRAASDAGPGAPTRPEPVDRRGAAQGRLEEALAAARDEGDRQRRRAVAAEDRASRAEGIRHELEDEVGRLNGVIADLTERATEDRRRHDRRLARLQRRVAEAEARGRADPNRVRRAVDDLERLAADLRGALEPATADDADSPEERTTAIPRTTPAARAGRPCSLPPGVDTDGAPAVRALLQVPGLEVVVDGYNVTKDARGRPHADLEVQRRWLLAHARGVAARFGRRLTVVFDGTDERPGSAPWARDLRVTFSSGEETADDRIAAIVASLDHSVPVLVVSSDREVQAAADAARANVVSAGSFIEGTGG